MTLTSDAIDQLPTRALRYDATDPQYPGFGVRVHPTGVKSYFYRYRIKSSVRMMRLGHTSYLGLSAALKIYQHARSKRLQGIDPQGTHPTTEEAKYVLLELWVSYDTSGAPPESLLRNPTVEDVAAYYGVTTAAVRKLVDFGYLSIIERNGRRVVIPLRHAIRRVGEGDIRLY